MARPGLNLDVEQVLQADFTLEVGQVSETVEVTGTPPLLQTTEGSLSTVVGRQVLTDFPLNGRSFQDLVSLGAGVVPTTRATRIGLGDVSANGARFQSNNYVLDGADNNSNIFNSQNNDPTAYAPPPDALSEFKVLTNSYSAEYGRGAGAAISATIRSGSNEFHGSAYEFLRNDQLDARNFFATGRGKLRRNQFGGTLGGPVVRNKSFFFFSYEGRTIRTPGSDAFANVPAARAASGDLSAYKRIFDPINNRAPFPDNRIPASRIDPVSTRLATMWPEANAAGILRNHLYKSANKDDRDKYDARVDHTFSSRDSLFFRLSVQQQASDGNRGLPLLVESKDVNRNVQETNGRSAAAGQTHVLGPSAVNEFRAAFHWTRSDVNWGTSDNIASKFSIPGLPAVMLATAGMPAYNVSGMNAIGGATFRPNLMREQTLQFKDSLFLVRGSHTLKIGAEFKKQHIPFSVAQSAMGQYSFTGAFSANGAGTGEGLADFLLGYPATFQGQSRTSAANMRRFITAGYFNDDWKLTNRLTLNLGIRYEFFSPLVDTQNRFSSFDPATGTFRIAKEGGLEERSLVQPDYGQFAPRIGLAYRLTDDTVLRAGYGLFYSGEEPLGAGFWLQNNPNFVVGVNLFAAPPTPLLKLETGLPANLFCLGGVAAPAATGIQYNARIAYVQNWNFTLQRMVGNWSAQASYVGSNGFHFLTPVFLNQARPGTGTVQSRRQYPAYGTITFVQDRGKTNYHALQTQLERTFSNGLSLLVSYTYAKAIDDHEDMFGRIAAGNQYPLTSTNLSLERSLSGTDIRHRVTYSMLYQLPFGRGRKLMSQAPKAVDLALGGWNVAAVTSFFSGSPFSVITSQDACGCGLLTGQFRADRLRDGRLPGGQRSIDGWFDVRAFALPTRGMLGSSGRNILISPGSSVVNLSVIKSFQIHESKLIQFRAEFFNFPNHPNFGLPGINIETAGAGLIRSADPGREIQLALRFQF